MILMIDNYDSFTYNLVQLFGELGQEVRVYRNDAITPKEAEKLKPDYLVISPGPCTPQEAGNSVEMIRHFAGKVPILGVCLGHQAVGAAFGAEVVQAPRLMHGKPSDILHDSRTIFSSLPPVFSAVRYHSLIVEPNSLPDTLEVSAWTAEGEVMALRHREFEVEGVQFHPESVATAVGRRIIQNFLQRVKEGPAIDMKRAVAKLVKGEDLNRGEMTTIMRILMDGEATAAQTGAFLTALSIKGETVEEISAATQVMRDKAIHVPIPPGFKVVDTCGTGGDGAHTFNISTAAALIASGAGIPIAKHGNRSVSSRCGSADVLQELGVNTGINAGKMAHCINQAGIGFLFAPTLHSAMRHVIGPRREIGIRSIFNILGPLSNPAFAQAQLLGVFDRKLVPVMAGVLRNVGVERALVVHGSDGLDEITLTGSTYVAELNKGNINDWTLDPTELGLQLCPSEELAGGTVQENAHILTEILEGKDTGPRRDVAVLNAAAVIYVGGAAQNLVEALELARDSLASGKALIKLEALRKLSNA
ncbi:MAG: bifunctional anthranilate synthase component II/anthranilate phosphoribosyltransferase [Spirochaetaceae bacterium]|nr:MAG: bifunctional anthranilate synthase component II/anthranilate phosphoribosyltransferase [Spirochaetaceae bacterium]